MNNIYFPCCQNWYMSFICLHQHNIVQAMEPKEKGNNNSPVKNIINKHSNGGWHLSGFQMKNYVNHNIKDSLLKTHFLIHKVIKK